MTYKILVVEDDFTIASELKTMMTGWGYDVKLTENFEDILGEFQAFSPHLILMDIGLPFANGFIRCQKIREVSKVPVIFLSSASDNINLVTAINMGADDFVAKPFDFNVLTAKIMAVLRRAYAFTEEKSDVIEYRGAQYNASDSTISVNGQKLDLTKLCQKQGKRGCAAHCHEQQRAAEHLAVRALFVRNTAHRYFLHGITRISRVWDSICCG